jgi:hypothetical protein
MAERQFGEPAIHYKENNHACGDSNCCGMNLDYIPCSGDTMLPIWEEGMRWSEEYSLFFTTEAEEVTCESCKLRAAIY